MKIIFLGTNGWYDTKTGNTICTLIDAKDYFVVLDAGSGFHKLDKYINKEKPVYLFLSHFHLDHIIGLHILNKFAFKRGISVYGQKYTKNILKKIVNKPFTMPFEELPFDANIYEIPEKASKLPFLAKSKPLIHSSICFGYRFEIKNKIITYCSDTGFCQNAVELAKNADLFIAECSYKTYQHGKNWSHLSPKDAAEIAKEAKVKRLVLTHFDANIYRTLKERKNAQKIAKTIFKNTISAVDNMKIEI